MAGSMSQLSNPLSPTLQDPSVWMPNNNGLIAGKPTPGLNSIGSTEIKFPDGKTNAFLNASIGSDVTIKVTEYYPRTTSSDPKVIQMEVGSRANIGKDNLGGKLPLLEDQALKTFGKLAELKGSAEYTQLSPADRVKRESEIRLENPIVVAAHLGFPRNSVGLLKLADNQADKLYKNIADKTGTPIEQVRQLLRPGLGFVVGDVGSGLAGGGKNWQIDIPVGEKLKGTIGNIQANIVVLKYGERLPYNPNSTNEYKSGAKPALNGGNGMAPDSTVRERNIAAAIGVMSKLEQGNKSAPEVVRVNPPVQSNPSPRSNPSPIVNGTSPVELTGTSPNRTPSPENSKAPSIDNLKASLSKAEGDLAFLANPQVNDRQKRDYLMTDPSFRTIDGMTATREDMRQGEKGTEPYVLHRQGQLAEQIAKLKIDIRLETLYASNPQTQLTPEQQAAFKGRQRELAVLEERRDYIKSAKPDEPRLLKLLTNDGEPSWASKDNLENRREFRLGKIDAKLSQLNADLNVPITTQRPSYNSSLYTTAPPQFVPSQAEYGSDSKGTGIGGLLTTADIDHYKKSQTYDPKNPEQFLRFTIELGRQYADRKLLTELDTSRKQSIGPVVAKDYVPLEMAQTDAKFINAVLLYLRDTRNNPGLSETERDRKMQTAANLIDAFVTGKPYENTTSKDLKTALYEVLGPNDPIFKLPVVYYTEREGIVKRENSKRRNELNTINEKVILRNEKIVAANEKVYSTVPFDRSKIKEPLPLVSLDDYLAKRPVTPMNKFKAQGEGGYDHLVRSLNGGDNTDPALGSRRAATQGPESPLQFEKRTLTEQNADRNALALYYKNNPTQLQDDFKNPEIVKQLQKMAFNLVKTDGSWVPDTDQNLTVSVQTIEQMKKDAAVKFSRESANSFYENSTSPAQNGRSDPFANPFTKMTNTQFYNEHVRFSSISPYVRKPDFLQ